MAVAAEVQVGAGCINGIQGAIAITGFHSAATFNIANRDISDNFKMEEIVSQDGAVVETIIASQQYKEYSMEFAPKGATRAAAASIAASFSLMTPLTPITVSGSTVAIFNGAYNYAGGASIKETRDGVVLCNVKLRRYQTAADGAIFGALAVVSG